MVDAVRRKSIRGRLLVFLVSILLLILGAAALVTYRGAVSAANHAYDRALLEPAVLLAQNVALGGSAPRLDLPPKALETLLYDQADETFFQIRARDGRLLVGTPELPPAPPLLPGQHAFFDGNLRSHRVRVAALHTEDGLVVQVAETLVKRKLLVREMMLAELVPTLLIALASIGLAWIGVVRALAPLEQIRAELLRRSPRDLNPLSDRAAPAEIAPVVAAFNRLLAEVQEATARQKRFLANAAHQLRTPLAGLQLHLELLLRPEHFGDMRAQLERLRDAIVRAGHLANQLLALAKAESASDASMAVQRVDLTRVAEAAARQWVPQALARRLDLGFDLAPAFVIGDPALLGELVNNLVDNALRYTPPGGSITVRCGQRGDGAYLSVEDTGPGIPAEDRVKVLERFYRVAGTPGEGSGLGLAIVKEVADQHGAAVQIGSAANDRGTVVTVLFPPAGSAPLPVSPEAAERSAQASEAPAAH